MIGAWTLIVVPAIGALSGVWEAVGDQVLPRRLVVERLRAHWATVLVGWGDDPAGAFPQGSVRATAKVLPAGQLFVRQPGRPAQRNCSIICAILRQFNNNELKPV